MKICPVLSAVWVEVVALAAAFVMAGDHDPDWGQVLRPAAKNAVMGS
jgi:hypothetical protein